MKKILNTVLLAFLISFNLSAQDVVELTDDEIRNIEINELLELVKTNKSIFLNEDNKRLNSFITKVSDRQALLDDAKTKLANEIDRNINLEASFEQNEKTLAELEEKLEIKVGVLGELFGVTRQYAGELLAASENSVVFYEFPNRPEVLKDIGQEKVHNLDQLENLWISYFDEIVAGSEIKNFEATITAPNGENIVGEVTRYGLFSASYDGKFVKPVSSLNSFQLLAKQPENTFTKTLSKHKRADEYTNVSIDPTRGFLLSLYLDKANWFERIAQGKSIGFVIIFIGFIGLAFSIFKITKLREYSNEVLNDKTDNIPSKMESLIKDGASRESKENIIDEFIINYSSKIEWGNNWVKFFAAVAPLLGLLGTVIGMIETFQAITLFGTGDPKQMAGGISQALVTTMLGLIVAAPLLGMYTYLSEKTESIVQVLEEKASYILSKD
ncbi:MotA/TolQ/ExbB proton channel family protein [Gammaproteobacteria bacterium]|jgi:biopolymer transport protein ExbB|nr:MotA/TolQ/ExbB proton channel family protein [Gammaproteobacteria bacterium]